jgi:hypothetical protein
MGFREPNQWCVFGPQMPYSRGQTYRVIAASQAPFQGVSRAKKEAGSAARPSSSLIQ